MQECCQKESMDRNKIYIVEMKHTSSEMNRLRKKLYRKIK